MVVASEEQAAERGMGREGDVRRIVSEKGVVRCRKRRLRAWAAMGDCGTIIRTLYSEGSRAAFAERWFGRCDDRVGDWNEITYFCGVAKREGMDMLAGEFCYAAAEMVGLR